MIPLLFALLTAAPAPLALQAAAAPEATAPHLVEETQLERDTRQLSQELRCPVCQGLSLQDSPAELSQEMRAIIREQLLAGRTVPEVKAYFVEKYGEWILLEPTASGFNLTVYILPVLMLLGGAVFLYSVARKWTRQGGAAAVERDADETVNV